MLELAAQNVVSRRLTQPWWLEFPVYWIIGNPKLERFFARGVWLIIPLQYYVLTRLSNGFRVDSYTPSTVMALISIVALFALSCMLALPSLLLARGSERNLPEHKYSYHVRIWAVTLIVSWAATLGLLALSYAVAFHMQMNADFVGLFVFRSMNWTGRYPTFELPTIVTYVLYASIAVGAVVVAARLARKQTAHGGPSQSAPGQPNIIVIIGVIALQMTLLHGISTLPHHASNTQRSPFQLSLQFR